MGKPNLYRMPWPERFRWWTAKIVDRLPWTCWSALVDWVLSYDREERRDVHPLRNAFGVRECRAEAASAGTCYCGQQMNRARLAVLDAEWRARYGTTPPPDPAPAEKGDDPWPSC